MCKVSFKTALRLFYLVILISLTIMILFQSYLSETQVNHTKTDEPEPEFVESSDNDDATPKTSKSDLSEHDSFVENFFNEFYKRCDKQLTDCKREYEAFAEVLRTTKQCESSHFYVGMAAIVRAERCSNSKDFLDKRFEEYQNVLKAEKAKSGPYLFGELTATTNGCSKVDLFVHPISKRDATFMNINNPTKETARRLFISKLLQICRKEMNITFIIDVRKRFEECENNDNCENPPPCVINYGAE